MSRRQCGVLSEGKKFKSLSLPEWEFEAFRRSVLDDTDLNKTAPTQSMDTQGRMKSPPGVSLLKKTAKRSRRCRQRRS